MLGRLRRAAVGPPARGRAADHGQGRRLRRHPRRRRRLQAAELDERARTRSSTGDDAWVVTNPKGERLTITLHEVVHDSLWELGVDPGLQKDGVEAHLQELLAASPHAIEDGLARSCAGSTRRRSARSTSSAATATARSSPSRSSGAARSTASSSWPATSSACTSTRRSAQVRGVFVAQVVKPQARVLAEARGFRWVEVDYDELRGLAPTTSGCSERPVLRPAADGPVPTDERLPSPAMPQEVRGVVARAKGEPVTIETIVVPDPGPGEAVVDDPGLRRVPHRPALPRGRDQRRVPVPARPRGRRHRRGRRRRRHRRGARRLRDPQLAGRVRQVPGVPARRAVVLLRHPQRDPEDDARPTAPSCRRRSASARSSRRRSSPPASARRSTPRRRPRRPGCSAAA